MLGVLGGVQQGVRLPRAARLHLDHPPVLVRARVDLHALRIIYRKFNYCIIVEDYACMQ
jgi:hypothetical protein